MNATFSTKALRAGIPVLVSVLAATIYAQDPAPTPTPAPNPLAGISVQVLDQQQVTIGTHAITYQRIAPPVFLATRNAGDASKAPTRPAQSGSSEDKQFQALFLSATVYDHQFTALRWCDGTAPGLQAYVNLDFGYFSTVGTFETAGTIYELIFASGNETASSLVQTGQPLPDFSAVPAGVSGYQIVAGAPDAYPEAIATLKALCAYYDAHRAQMIVTYNRQQAANAAQQQWLQNHPPVTPDTVVNFWPIKSSVYPTTTR
jgi:hypothetical protein